MKFFTSRRGGPQKRNRILGQRPGYDSVFGAWPGKEVKYFISEMKYFISCARECFVFAVLRLVLALAFPVGFVAADLPPGAGCGTPFAHGALSRVVCTSAARFLRPTRPAFAVRVLGAAACALCSYAGLCVDRRARVKKKKYIYITLRKSITVSKPIRYIYLLVIQG